MSENFTNAASKKFEEQRMEYTKKITDTVKELFEFMGKPNRAKISIPDTNLVILIADKDDEKVQL